MTPHNLLMPTNVAIVGATGYAGGELARLVLRHPEARLVAAVARSGQGEPLRKLQPHLHAAPDSLVVGSDVGDAEVVFTALPAGEAAKQAGTWLDEGRTVIDIGSDFRLRDPVLYERWYGYTHPAPALLAEADVHATPCPDDEGPHRDLLPAAQPRRDSERHRRCLRARVRRGAVHPGHRHLPRDEGDSWQ